MPEGRFATDALANLTTGVANSMCDRRERMTIFRFSKQGGGYYDTTASGYTTGTHRNGNNVDIAFYNNQGVEESRTFVRDGQVTPDFDIAGNFKMMRELVRQGHILHMLVDRKIKKKLCEVYSGSSDPLDRETLRLMRPGYYTGSGWTWHSTHKNHVHVAVKCEPDHPA